MLPGSGDDLQAGIGFQIEVKLVSPEGHESLPNLDQLVATFHYCPRES